jgi:flagellar biosynthetic protein FlhB
VLTNPTHYAVALGFDFGTMEAPKVVAKGRNLLAEEIKAEARWAGVPIIENPPLARSLYRQRLEAEMRERRARETAARARAQAQAGAQSGRPGFTTPPFAGGPR